MLVIVQWSSVEVLRIFNPQSQAFRQRCKRVYSVVHQSSISNTMLSPPRSNSISPDRVKISSGAWPSARGGLQHLTALKFFSLHLSSCRTPDPSYPATPTLRFTDVAHGTPQVKLWSIVDLSPLATLDVMATPSVAGLRQVRSICLSSDGTKVLVGTLGSDILELATVEKPSGGDDGEEEEEVCLSCRKKHHLPQYCFPQSRQHKDNGFVPLFQLGSAPINNLGRSHVVVTCRSMPFSPSNATVT